MLPSVMVALGVFASLFVVGIPIVIYGVIVAVRLATTEVAVTDRRVVGKVGWIAMNSLDLRLSKLEGVTVRRSLLGAMLNYGSVAITGSGNARVLFRGMSDPEGLRRALVEAAEECGSSSRTSDPSRSVAMPVFEVQVVDGSSGDEAWIQVVAQDKEEALRRATDTGMIVGSCRLKSIG